MGGARKRLALSNRRLVGVGLAVLGLGGSLVSCAQRGSSPRGASNPLGRRESAGFLVHQNEGGLVRARLEIARGSLILDDSGNRSLLAADGSVERATIGPPEILVDVVEVEGRYWFLGVSGAMHVTREPLGEFVEHKLPNRRLVSAVLRRDRGSYRVAGIDDQGTLVVSEPSSLTFRPTNIRERALGVGLGPAGELFVLVVPERILISRDFGASFRDAVVERVGAERLWSESGKVHVSGLLGSFRLSEGNLAQDAEEGLAIPAASAHWVKAEQVTAGHGGLARGFVASVEKREKSFFVQSGSARGAISERAAEELADCREVRAAYDFGTLHVLCVLRGGGGIVNRLAWFRGDPGRALERSELALRGAVEQLVLRPAPGGELLVSGLCEAKENAAGCVPHGVQRLRRGEPVSVPSFGLGEVIDYRADEEGNVFMLLLGDMNEVTLLGLDPVSRTIFRRVLPPAISPSGEPLTGLLSFSGPAAPTVHLWGGSGNVVLRFNREGELRSHAFLPPEIRSVSVRGDRVFGIDAEAKRYFESDSGGLDFGTGTLPLSACVSGEECETTVICDDELCLVGDLLVKDGWGLAGESEPFVPPLNSRPMSGPPRTRSSTCLLDGSAERLDGVTEPPGAHEALLGESAWIAAGISFETAGATVHSVPRGGERIEHRELFSRVTEPTAYAITVHSQVEGLAALRYRVGRLPKASVARSSRSGPQEHSEIEVVWDNRLRSIFGRNTLTRPPHAMPGDSEPTGYGAEVARPGLLSIGGDGIFVRLHPNSAPTGVTHYLTRAEDAELSAPDWPENLRSDEQEPVRIGGTTSFLAWFAGGRTLARVGADKAVSAFTLGLPNPESFGLVQTQQAAYVGAEIGFITSQTDLGGTYWASNFVPLTADGYGEPIPVPHARDVETLVACSAEDIVGTPRVVTSAPPRDEWKLHIDDGGRSIELTYAGMVLHGTPAHPCVAAMAYRSQTGSIGSEDQYGALVFPSGGTVMHSWLFRSSLRSDYRREVSSVKLRCP